MKTNQYLINTMMILALGMGVVGCGKIEAPSAPLFGGVSSPQTPNPNPPGPVYADDCTDFSGKYQMNTDLFVIEQTECKKFVWKNQPTYFNPNPKTITYEADGLDHEVESQVSGATALRKAYFLKGDDAFYVEDKLVAGAAVIQTVKTVYTRTMFPCDLINPSGEIYLQRLRVINGDEVNARCIFWEMI